MAMSSRLIASVVICSALAVPNAPIAAQARGAYLGDLSWPEAERRLKEAPMVIIPFGAGAKEHGPHLPLSADQIAMEYFAAVAVDSLPVVVAPPILYGWFPAFRELPGTTIDDPDVFYRYVLEVARSLVRHGAKRVVFLNLGITRSTGIPLALVARTIYAEERVPTLLISSDDLATPEVSALTTQRVGGHADDIETSMILALRPALVHMDRAVRDYRADTGATYPGYRPGHYSRQPGDPDFSETGLTGDPTLATAEKGRKILAIKTRQWMKALRGFASTPVSAGR